MSKQWWENDPIASDDSSSKAGNWWEKDPVADGGAAPKKNLERSAGDVVGDVAVTALKGAIGLPQSIAGWADIATGGRAGKKLEELGFRPEEAKQILDGMYSEAQQEANRQVRQAQGFVPTIKAALDNPSVIATTVGESVPQMLGGMAAARGLMLAAPAVAPWVAAGIGEGLMGAGAAAAQMRAESEDGLLTPKQSGAAVASGVGTGILGAAGGKIAQRMGVPDVDVMLATGKLAKSPAGFVKAVAGAGLTEGVFEELPQSIQEQMWQNWATGKPITEGVGNAAALGMLSGAAMGGAGGGYNAAMASLGKDREDGQDQTAGAAGQTETSAGEAAPAMGGAAAAAAGSAAARRAPANVETVGVGNTAEAERALREPVNLTALDRANEIDTELTRITERRQELTPENGYGPSFDQERAELDIQLQSLSQERESIVQTWPKAERGGPTSFSTEAGVKIEGQYALMDAADLVTSHDESLRANPLYPAELQPRDRSRQASEMQVSGIVQKLDPARLGVSADAATGAPIVGADGLVESGNARTIALKRVYQANGQKAEDYKNFLRTNAAQFGIDPAQVDGMARPVLVRVRATPVNRAEFARQANATTVQRMSASEQALADSKRLTTLEGLNPDDDGNFTNSLDFIRQFMATLPVTEQSDLIESDGRLSTQGYRRIQNAVLAKAYGDSPTLRRMTESLDNNLRNISNALTRVAPTIASARERMQMGTMHEADIAPDLVQAVEGLSSLKDKGWSVADELGQQDLTGPKYSPEAAQLLQFLSENARSPRRIAEFIQRYYEALEQAGDPSQASMFDDGGPAPSRTDLLSTARGTQDGDTAQNPERGIDREGARPAAQDGGQPEDATGNRGGDQGDGPASPAADGGQPGQQDSQADARAQAVAQFKDALADLTEIASRHTKAYMVDPGKIPDLMPTLVNLFDAAIKIVGTDLKAVTKWVKDQLKADERTRKFWNKIDNATYQKAALQALEQMDKPAQAGLFDSPEAATEAVQGDLFASPQPVRKADTIVIDGQEYDLDAPNFGMPLAPITLQKGDPLLVETDKKALDSEVTFDGRTMTRAEMHQTIIGWHFQRAQPAPADRKPIAFVMGGGGASGKGTVKKALRQQGLIRDDGAVNLDPDEIKLEIPEYKQIVAAGDSRAAAMVHEESSDLAKKIKARAIEGRYDLVLDVTLGDQAKGIKYLQELKDAGYEVRLIGVTTDPQTSVIRAIKRAQGSGRWVPINHLLQAHKGFNSAFPKYAEVADSAYLYENTDGRKNVAEKQPGGDLLPGNGYNVIAERSVLNEQARTLREIGRGAAERSGQAERGRSTGSQEQAGRDRGGADGPVRGRESGSGGARAAGQPERGLFLADEVGAASGAQQGSVNADRRTGESRPQGQEPDAAQAAERPGRTQQVRRGSRGADQRAGDNDDAGRPAAPRVGQAGPDGVRGTNADGQQSQPRSRARRDAGVPAGRDIPPKSGRNYAFGPSDLTYQGSWYKKAEQNVAAIELLQTLKKEGRQANREEQAKLAQFIGWGASEIANTLFGDKLDKAAEALREYDTAMDGFRRSDGRALTTRDTGYYSAFRVLQAASKTQLNYYSLGAISREMVEKAKPEAGTKRWLELRDRLKAVMTKEQWAEASRSTQYAHYTSKEVVKSMWAALDRMGFKGGSILEPGAGIGVFPGLMPEAMANNSIYTGIEFDTFTGEILQQLFPDERILVESFVDSKLPKNFYDVAVGNPPFSGTKILSDPEYAKRAFSLHDYFFAKSIDRVKPGGLVVYVTSRYTMDKLDDKARGYLAERADLVGAIRLPQTAFKQNAGTEVVTDVIFLRKKVPGQTFEGAQAWGKSVPITVNGAQYNINEYFAANPKMVLGTHSDAGSMYKDREYTVDPIEGDIEVLFAKAVENLPAGIYQAERGSSAEAAQVREIDFNPKAQKEGNYYVTDAGQLMVREGGVGQRVDLRSQKDVDLIKDFVPLRDALKQAHYDQLNDGQWEASLKTLQKAYADFTKKHGQINQFTTKVVKTKATDEDTGETYTDEATVRVYPLLKKLEDDPDYTLVAALETINDDTGEIKPSAFLSDRVLGKPAAAEIGSPTDALLSSLNDVGRVDIPLIAQRINLTPAETIEALGSTIYEDPEAGWLTADEYLSGNVKRKLDAAREAAKGDKRFERNVSALEAVQPAPKTPSQINVGIGMNWVPGEVYSDFLRQVAGVRANVEFNDRTKQWVVQEQSGGRSMQATADWGTGERNATELLEHALTGRPVRITRTVGTGSDRKTVFDAPATEAANQKLEALKDRFASWVWENAERTDRLVQLYNDTFNTTVPRAFDGSHLTLPGTSKAFSVFDHVKRGAWRIIQSGNTYLAHAVGSGKTFQMVIAAMEQKRLGLIKKPMVVVPNHMLKQFAHEWQMLYPAARLMVADENNFHTDNRRRFVSRVALSDLDGVVITHSAFKLLDLDPEFKSKMIEEQLEFMRAALQEAEDAEGTGGKKSPRIKQIEKQIENLEEKLKAAMASTGKDTNVRFDELGVDFLMVDEAHEFRKLEFATGRQVKGISPQGSARSFDLYMKSRYLEEKTPGRSLVMASGTPVTNTLAELFTVQKFMDRQALIDRNIDDFDSWAAMFGRERTVLEPNAAGKYEPVTRFSKFVNVPELTQMFREYADVLTADHLAALLGDKRPKVEGGSRNIIVTPKTEAYAEFQSTLSDRVEKSRAWKPSKDEPNNPDPMIRIIGDGRLAAIDMRFMDPSLPSDPDSKLNRLADDVIRVFKETADMEFRDKSGNVEPNKGAAMMVFSDLGFGAGVAANRGFNARAWLEKRLRDAGVNMSQVAFMSDYKKSADKLKLFKDVNAGRVRVLVGSSKNMGTGVNAQQRLKALFHLDSPWYPADLEQREGRIIRQGNKNPLVQIYAYAAKGTYDENMWKMLASKQFFIDQALSGDQNLRELEDLDSQSQYDLAAAMVAEDPRILQLAGAKAEIEKLQRLYRAHEDQRARFKQQYDTARLTVEFNEKRLPEAEKQAGKVQDLSGDKFRAKVLGKTLDERAKWADALIEQYKTLTAKGDPKPMTIGEISGFPLVFGGETVAGQYTTKVVLGTPEPVLLIADAGTSPIGVAMRAQNAVLDVARLPAKMRERLTEARAQMDALQTRLEAPFPMAGMLADKTKEAADLEAQIAADSQLKTWRVENKASGLGFDVEATSAVEAVAKAIATNGGTAEDWVAIEAGEQKPADDTRLARGAGTGGMDVKVLDALVQKIQAKMPNLPKVQVLADPSKAPKALREYINRQDAWNDVEGAYHDGQLYLFASGLGDPLRAEHVLAEHEAAHFGLRAILGDSLRTAMNLVYAQNASVRKAAAELQKRGKLSNVEAVEEVIVDIPTAELAKLKGWRKVVQMAADWLGAHGFDRMAQKLSDWLDGTLSDQQRADLFVAELVRGAREYVAGKQSGRRPGRGTGSRLESRLSTTLAEDIARQEKWLQAEARARGFNDIEDLLEKDYPLFEKLATIWREKNPAENGVLLSRSPSTKAAYEKRIDELFAGGKPKFKGVKMLDRADMLDLLGLGSGPLHIVEGKVMSGQDKHKLRAEHWKKIPEWLDNPAMVFDSETVPGRLVFIAPETLDGVPIRMVVEPSGDGAAVHLLVNSYDAEGRSPMARWMREGLLRYIDQKTTPGLSERSKLRLPGLTEIRGRTRILTEKQLAGYRRANPESVLSRASNKKTATERADAILAEQTGKLRPLDAAARAITRVTGIERLAGAAYNRAAYLLDRYTPETVKAGVMADYGVPQAVIDQRVLLQGRQRVQLRKAGELIDKLSTLTRAESRVAYEWMNMDGSDPKAYLSMMQGLPEESVKVLTDVQKMIDQLSKEAVRLGQLSPDAYERNKFAYLRRSYAKHIMEQTAGEKAKRARVISILGEQYRGRGLTESAPMATMQNAAPDWWGRKLKAGKGDAGLKGEKFIRLEYRTHKQSGVAVRMLKNGKAKPYYISRSVPLDTKTGQIPGLEVAAHETTLKDVVYWPASQAIPQQYAEWDQAGTWEVRDTKGPNLVLWRDFTKDEREVMGEVDEARFAIAKTLHGMVHDVEVGRYMEWMAVNQAKKDGETIPGQVVEASERYKDTFKPGEWVRVPDTKISGTNVFKYGKLAGRYLPGPVWNDLRQVVNGQFKPFGDTYAKLLSLWKTSKTALSPAVHMNNIMSNFVMADFHDVGAAHIAKSLRIILAASQRDGKGLIGRTGNALARGGIADHEAAREILNRYADSGGDIGSWVTNEIAQDQLEPLLDSLEKELQATAGASVQAQTGVFAALQHAMMLRFPSAWEAFKPTMVGKAVTTEAGNLINLYQAEDDVFRLAAWLKAKEEGQPDIEAGKRARKSFLDYNINAPWIQAMRQSAWPFISFTYRAVPMLLEVAGKKPHKLMKLMMIAGGLNALGALMAGGDDGEERKLLPEEKAGKIWGMVPKLIRMPWNDEFGSPVYLDIRRFVPVGDVFDVGQGNAAIPVLPGLMPGGPLVLAGEVVLNRSAFTGKPITLDTDTGAQQAAKVADHLYKAFAPNILGLPNTYATEGVVGSMTGRTDAFGREMSTAQAVASSFGVKLGSYPADVLRRNLNAKAQAELMEIQKNISQLKRQRQTNRLDADEYRDAVEYELAKKQKIMRELQEKMR